MPKRQAAPERRRSLVEINLLTKAGSRAGQTSRGCLHLFGLIPLVIVTAFLALSALR
jgi:hypothetical protein